MSAGWDVALEQIEQADLPATVYRTAIRLLRRASADGGTFALEEAELLDICQTDAEGTVRSHLVQLAAAGIIRYKRRGFVTITFLAWMGEDENLIAQRSLLWQDEEIRALSDQIDGGMGEDLIAERSNSDEAAPIRALSDQKARAQRSKSASTSHARSGRWVGRSLSTTRKRKEPTYPPKPSHDPSLNEVQQLALGLLEDSDVGILHEIALTLVASKPVQDIYRAVDRWLPEFQAGKVGVGALKHRIETAKPSATATVSLSAGFLASDLFQRHRLPDEMVDGKRRKYSVEADEMRRKYSL